MSNYPNINAGYARLFMLTGAVDAGKTTLFNSLLGRVVEARKTQAVDYESNLAVDTPGEFFSHPRMYHALINTAADVQTLVYVHAANDFECRMPPGLLDIYPEKQLVVVITKIDLPDADIARVTQLLRAHRLNAPTFCVSIKDEESLSPLRQFLLHESRQEEAVSLMEILNETTH